MAGVATARAHTNIALIKYWGKRDVTLKLPYTSSISLTLGGFFTETTVRLLPAGSQSTFLLDGTPAGTRETQRVMNYIAVLQRRHGVSGPVAISSVNHVPMAAGLASSSSAFSALAASFARAYELDVDRTELSRMARLGSGSASRSVFGGFVKWNRGTDDETSVAVPLDETPRLDLVMIAVEIDTGRKAISSSQGMQAVVETSAYYETWVRETERACSLMEAAIARQDFTAIGQLAQQNALEMHALNLTARPGFTYFAPATLTVLAAVGKLREEGVECYSTMDAGPNVKVLAHRENVKEIEARLHALLPAATMTSSSCGPGVEYLPEQR